ncbi:ribonuclease T2 [Nadsonia fulvescens var. elongata DSM 6958]|uniref:Ribonuclease T2-like n=1 Tax=Nadsonia fulvescens var. elongata DSM 6958 TaxID=857566 RepID=A0A1E3PQE5_9ASCO|nr:ribonuclease T2 [Nadsonia fulvescens var. elongata DSM 6958]
MVSIRILPSIIASTLLATASLAFVSPYLGSNEHIQCPIDTPLSCGKSPFKDSCCYESPGGVLLLTQFWDYRPGIGANDTFTLHGLWPDNCDGSFEQFCDRAMEITNATEILLSRGYGELLERVKKVWLSNNGFDERLWLHEFNKHGTCMSTIKSNCYKKDVEPYQYIIDFFQTTLDLYDQLPTFEWLQDAGILPSTETTYTLQEIQSALSKQFNGFNVRLGCKGNALNEIWYFFNLKGSIPAGKFIPIQSLAADSCPLTGIRFPPKVYGSDPSHPGNPGSGRGGKRGVIKLSGQPGCLISSGEWYTSGSCANFIMREAEFGGITLSSSKGNCDVVKGQFSCTKRNSLGQFLLDKETNDILYGGKNEWSADNQPRRYQKKAAASLKNKYEDQSL